MTDLPLKTLTHEFFSSLVQQTFSVSQAQLTLSGVKVLGPKRGEVTREPFSLLFSGAPQLRLSQGIHRFEIDGIGALEIFITQVGDGPRGSEFEAIFS